MKINKKVSLIFTLLLMLTSNLSAASATEKAALVALYNSTGGDNWANNSNWNTGDPCTNSWYGVYCDGNENITSLYIVHNNLTGNIPTQIGNLTNLIDIALYSNQLTGTIPAQIGNLTNLIELYLDYNQLTGSIPAELENMTSLTILQLHDNNLTGSIPVEIGNMTNLVDLSLYVNNLTGSIPTEIGNMVNLEYLGLFNNQLTGSIPVEIGNLTNLKYLDLYDNNLTGAIPSEIGGLTNLKDLSLYSNQLTGSIPAQIWDMTNLTALWLGSNQLTGSIPVEIANLTNITSLTLNDNYLSGEIPTEIRNLTTLRDTYGLKLENNCNLYTNDVETQGFILLKSRELGSYEAFLLTQSNCQPETPNTCPMNDINLNSTIFGTWDGSCDSTHRSGSYAKFYTFTLVNTKTVTITLKSDFDTFLYLLSGTNQSSTPLAFNDDYNVENYNSQIIAELAAGAYTIEATTWGLGVTDDFNLSLSGNSDMPPAIIMYLLN